MVDFLGGPICWGDLYRKDNWGDLKVWGDLILLGGPKTPLYTMVVVWECQNSMQVHQLSLVYFLIYREDPQFQHQE